MARIREVARSRQHGFASWPVIAAHLGSLAVASWREDRGRADLKSARHR
jgi:hypothetical protein